MVSLVSPLSTPSDSHRYWHVYAGSDLRPDVRGESLYLITFWAGHPRCLPAIRIINEEMSNYRQSLVAITRAPWQGIVYAGVNLESIQKTIELNENFFAEREFSEREITQAMIVHAQRAFLSVIPFSQDMPLESVALVQGSLKKVV